MKKILGAIILLFSSITGCFSQNALNNKQATFKSVSMKEGLSLMSKDKNYILLDVRRIDEYSSGHIPGAILHTNENMTKDNTEKLLKNKNQNIYVYCRSGRRSKEACKKLIEYGYKNIIEIGGIMDYTGPLEKK